MPTNDSDVNADNLLKLVNDSGFAFQIAVEAQVRSSEEQHGWKVAGHEHPWRTEESSGFLDLVLEQGIQRLLIECKRSRQAQWVFLLPDKGTYKNTTLVRYRWSHVQPGANSLENYADAWFEPASPQATFCVIRGQGDKDRPLLERIAGELLLAEEAIVSFQRDIDQRTERAQAWMFFPIIVTTAALFTCEFKAADVPLHSGELPTADFVAQKWVRLKKSFGPTSAYPRRTFSETSRLGERTVIVVQATALIEFLEAFSLVEPRESLPWNVARELISAARANVP